MRPNVSSGRLPQKRHDHRRAPGRRQQRALLAGTGGEPSSPTLVCSGTHEDSEAGETLAHKAKIFAMEWTSVVVLVLECLGLIVLAALHLWNAAHRVH